MYNCKTKRTKRKFRKNLDAIFLKRELNKQ